MRLYIILSDVHRQEHLRPDANRLRNARVMAHFFHLFFSPSSFISLVNPRLGRLWHLRFSMSPRDAIRAMLLRHSKSQRANTLPGLLDSALRSHKTTSHNGSDGRTLAQHPSPIHHPHPTLVSPTGLRQRELRPLRFNLTQHYYVFYHDCSR